PSPIWGTDPGSGHALLVTGIDLEHGTAVLSDTGDPMNGEHHVVPLGVLEDAWAMHDHKMVVTDVAAGEHTLVPDFIAPPEFNPVHLPDVDLPMEPALFTHHVSDHHDDLIPAG